MKNHSTRKITVKNDFPEKIDWYVDEKEKEHYTILTGTRWSSFTNHDWETCFKMNFLQHQKNVLKIKEALQKRKIF